MWALPPWNAVRFDESANRGHVESYFLKLNDGSGRRALWLKTTILARVGEEPVAEAWAIAFDREAGHRAAKEVVPFSSARFSRDGLSVRVAKVELDERGTRGEVKNERTQIGWNLRMEGREAALVPFHSEEFYTGSFPRSKLVSPHPDSRFFGSLTVDGETIEIDGWRGMQGHNWGASHTHRYAWGHVAGFPGANELVFEGATGRVRVGPVITPPITILCAIFRGVRYAWNRPRDMLGAHGDMTTRTWSFAASSDVGEIDGSMSVDTRDLVGLVYENPKGPPAHCLNSKIARCRLRFSPRGRAPIVVETDEAAFELGTTDVSHGVTLLA